MLPNDGLKRMYEMSVAFHQGEEKTPSYVEWLEYNYMRLSKEVEEMRSFKKALKDFISK